TELTGGLKELARAEGVTLYMVLLGAFQVLLSRYSGQSDIVVGSPIAGRRHQQLEGLIGFFLNTLALRTDLRGNPQFRDVLQRVKEVTLGAYAHQDIPFEKLVAELQPSRDLSRQPFFQVMLVLQNLPQERLAVMPASGLMLQRLAGGAIGSKFDMTLYVQEHGSTLVGTFEYATDLFDRETIERLGGHLRQLLQGIVEDPRGRIAQLPLLTEAEREMRRLPVMPAQELSGDELGYFERFERAQIEQYVVHRFAAQVARDPEALAIQDGVEAWSYQRVDRYANAVAEQLLKQCRGSQRIALLFEHEARMIGAMLGVLKAGMTYVPLDPHAPLERLRLVLADCEAAGVVAGSDCVSKARACAADGCPVWDAQQWSGTEDQPPVEVERSAQSLTYILYTSGTTGRPKGVVQKDGNVLHFIAAYTNTLRLHRQDRLSLLATYGFDAAVMDIYGALLNGASIHLWDVRRQGVANLAGWLTGQGITVWHSTPTLLRVATAEFAGVVPQSVRLVVLGGEEALRRDLERVREHFGKHCVAVNDYGPTESTVSLQYFISPGMLLKGDRIPIGRPVESTQVVLLSAEGEETDFVGELGIRSRYVALGYWKDEAQTRRVFNEETSGTRLYRTGDLVRYLGDGTLEYLGRAD